MRIIALICFGLISINTSNLNLVELNDSVITRSISLNDKELEDAKWLSRRDVEAQMQAGTFIPPPPISISFSLIEAWFDQDADVPLKELRETCVGSDI